LRSRFPTTLRIAILTILLALAGNAGLLAFIRFATFNEHEGLAEALERALWLSVAIALLFGIISGAFIARFVGRRVEEIARVADAVTAGNLSERAPVTRGGDAFDHLSQRVNAMLDRIETLMTELRILTDSLAHDLRSPVQRLRSRVEQALSTEDEAQRDQLLSGVLAETDALTRILTTALEISRSEAMTARTQFATIDTALLITELAEMYEPLAEEKGVVLRADVSGAAPIKGHRQLLAQALSNLIDNALNYGAGAPVTLFVAQDRDIIRLGVGDHGPGIAAKDVVAARRRFGRLDAARGSPGAGLGLSLVEAAAHLHGGTLELLDNGPGLRAAIVLPTTH
jgi:signal transduction histidine kinase